MKTFYLAHQLKYRKKVRFIQKYLESNYKINFINPFYDINRNDIIKIDSGINDRSLINIRECRNIVESDLTWVRSSDGVVCFVFDYMCLGSYMEVFYASKILDKPVYFICNVKRIREHPWIRSLCFKIFKNIKEYESYLFENGLVMK